MLSSKLSRGGVRDGWEGGRSMLLGNLLCIQHVSGCSMLVGILNTGIQHKMCVQHHGVCSKYPAR